MKPIHRDLARELIDFSGAKARQTGLGRRAITPSFAESQLSGAVASYNMLAQNRVAYIADEVGLGKTYVALGVMGLVRHFNPDARMLVVAPRMNIQLKWVKELRNFVRNNWLMTDNRVKSIHGTPARQPTVCHSLAELAHELTINADRDFYIRMTSFSLALKRPESRARYRQQLREHLSWLPARALRADSARDFRERYGCAFNALLPDIDLLVVDEAHNLRKGFGERNDTYVSNRNRIMGLALGHPLQESCGRPWYRQRVKHVLCLSATPLEDDYRDLWQQLDVLGAGNAEISGTGAARAFPVRQLAEPGISEGTKRKLASDLLLRRVTHLTIGGKDHTKNMYRREWRHGGFEEFDDPIRFDDPRQRLIVALVQKKVAEVLGSERFGNHFQIGMLSSFESFLETVGGIRRAQQDPGMPHQGQSEEEAVQATFDGRQTRKRAEQRGADTEVLNAVIESYRERFRQAMPHPKLDSAVGSLATAFETGEKALVFVRRVATVGELARRLDRAFDEWIRSRMKEALPGLQGEVDDLFQRFQRETGAGKDPHAKRPRADAGAGNGGELLSGVESDPGGSENFFSWFFRGEGPKHVLSGGAFQKNRLSNVGAVYSTFFEDDLVAWLLGRPEEPMACLAKRLDMSPERLEAELRGLAWAYFRRRTKKSAGYPRYYVFEAYQSAALHLLAQAEAEVAGRANEVLTARFPDHRGERAEPPKRFPPPESAIGVTTFFTELVKAPELRDSLWPEEQAKSFGKRFARREQRRELLSAMSRLGAAYIDLYLLAIQESGSFALKSAAGADAPNRSLARRFVARLAEQRGTPGFHAFAELNDAAEAFDTLIGVNFPEVPDRRLTELAEIFGRALQRQNPVGRMSGSVASRNVLQFRMPGFPMVLVSTDVLQEGEDLHTFCRKVIHYGITWTPSAMEQRTGRVDRIDSLLQRQLDGREQPPNEEEKIQIHYPHLEDTVERLQVKRVLQRLDLSFRLLHEPTKRKPHNRRIDMNREILGSIELPSPVEDRLKSAFPVQDAWLEGMSDRNELHRVDVAVPEGLLDRFWDRLVEDLGIERSGQCGRLCREGVVPISACASEVPDGGQPSARWQLVQVELRSAGIDGLTFLRCRSDIGPVDLTVATTDRLLGLQLKLGQPRLCARYQSRRGEHALSIEASLPFGPATTQYEEFRDLVSRVARQADELEEALLGVDAEGQRRLEESNHA